MADVVESELDGFAATAAVAPSTGAEDRASGPLPRRLRLREHPNAAAAIDDAQRRGERRRLGGGGLDDVRELHHQRVVNGV